MTIDKNKSDKVMELSARLHDIQADYISKIVELFTMLEPNSAARNFELNSRGLTEEDISILKSIPASCYVGLPLFFELDTGPIKKLNKFIRDNGLSHDNLPDEVSVIVESLQAERTSTVTKKKRL